MSKFSKIVMATALAGLTACVPSKQFQELKEKNVAICNERDSIKSLNEDLTVQTTELEAKVEELNKKLEKEATTKTTIRDSAQFYKKQYKVFKTMSGDIAFEPELQKCIAVDIRYVLLILDKYFDAQNLISEMKFAE